MELLYIVGALLALALLWRGVMLLRDYRRRIKVRLEPVPPGPEVVDNFPELGKVRVRPRFADEPEDDETEPALGPVIIVAPRGRDDDRAEAASARVDAVPAASLRAAASSAAPMPAPTPASAPVAVAPAAEPAAETEPAAPAPEGVEPAPALPPGAPDAAEAMPVLLTPVSRPLPEALQQDMFADDMIAPPPMAARPRNRAEVLYDTPAVEPVRPVRASEPRPPVEVQDVIALHVVAREHPFNGEDLLRCILGYGLRFGDMNIFHRHERPTGQGEVLFSMAKAVEPGTFDLQAMTGEEIPGVSFFQSLPGVSSILAYDIMVDTAKRLATELRGEILDEQQQPLTRQLVEHYRERVQEFERRRLMQRPAR